MGEMDDDQVGGDKPEQAAGVSRRSLLAGLAVCGGTLLGASIGVVRFMAPTVSAELPARFKLGYPEGFTENSVTYDEQHQVYVVRRRGVFYAMDARCTHLQCLVRWQEEQGIFFCPCHGSKFDREGRNFAGPAPRPLERLQISVAQDGRLLIEKDRIFDPRHWKDSLLEV